MELKVKKTIAEELGYLAKLESDSFEVNAKYFENGVIPPFPEEDEEKYFFKALSEQKDTETLTIFYKNEIVGGVIVKDIGHKAKEVLLFFIAPEMQGKNIR